MNSIIKNATVKRYHYKSGVELSAHFADFANVYNHRRRLRPHVTHALSVHLPDLDERARAIQV